MLDENTQVGDYEWSQTPLSDFIPNNTIIRQRKVGGRYYYYQLIQYTEKVSDLHFKTRNVLPEEIDEVGQSMFKCEDSKYCFKIDGKTEEIVCQNQ